MKATELAKAFEEVVQITTHSKSAESGWRLLIEFLAQHSSPNSLRPLERVSIGEDIDRLSNQLLTILNSEPPPKSVDTFWFGLFDTIDSAQQKGIGYYVAGVTGFTLDDGDSLCNPIWWPEERYLMSTALDAIKEAELHASIDGRNDEETFLAYAGQLGAAILVSKYAMGPFRFNRRLVVGFDSGDFAEVAA